MTPARTSSVVASSVLAIVAILVFVLAPMSPARAQQVAPAAGSDALRQAPAAVIAGDFYAWYLAELKASRDPLNDDPIALSTMVSKALLREIRRRMASPEGLDADYFLQAQDYDDDWLEHVSTRTVQSARASATVHVDLGASPATRHRLLVMLIREDARWKIRRVAPR